MNEIPTKTGEAHVTIDLETLGTAHNAVILSIGAVKFDPLADGEGHTDQFYVAISPMTCEAYGLKIDAVTVMEWLAPEKDNARAALLTHRRLDLATALDGFAMWYGPESLPTWSNTNESAILRSSYEAVGLDCPWDIESDRCYRTVMSLAPDIQYPPSSGIVVHDALDKAVRQADNLQHLFFHLGVDI